MQCVELFRATADSLVCSGNNVSTMGGFCLDRRHLKEAELRFMKRESADVNSPQTVKEIFLYSTVSTLKPMVGIVVTISPETEHG